MKWGVLGVAAVLAILVAAWQFELLPTGGPAVNENGPGKKTERSKGNGERDRPGRFSREILITTAEVELRPPQERIQALGTGKAAREVVVTADVAGTIETIHFKPNTDIASGEPLVTLERETQKIALGSAKANHDKARAALQRYEQLNVTNDGVVSQAQIDEARANSAVAEAELAAAQYEFDRRIITAPFAGRTNLTDLAVGSYLSQGSPIVTLRDASQILVEFSVAENAAAAVAVGVPVRMTTPAVRGRAFFGSIVAFDDAVDASARTIRVRARVDNPEHVLLPGTTFFVRIVPKVDPLPVVPAISITWSRNGASVWKLDGEDKPSAVPVVIRRRDGDLVWVEANLKAGDRVIRDGALKVSAGAAVRVKDAKVTNGS